MTSSQYSDSGSTRLSLISRARNRQEDAWCELIDLYGPLVASWCYRRGFNSHATADCVQDVFAAVAKSLASYRATAKHSTFRGWLWTITSNKIRDQARKDHEHDRAVGGSSAMADLQQFANPDSQPVNQIDQEPTSSEEIRQLMARAMEQVESEFEPKTWSMFIRSVVDQLPTEVVAEEFEVTAATVRKARSRIMRRLRLQLGDGL